MAQLPNVFIPEETDSNPFAPISAGWVLAEIVKSEIKTTKDKNGKYIAFTFDIDEGEEEGAGRKVYTNLNIVNNNETAVAIARSNLKEICEAVGFSGELEDTEDLHNIQMAIKLSVKPETPQWPAKNEIKAFRAADRIDELRGESSNSPI